MFRNLAMLTLIMILFLKLTLSFTLSGCCFSYLFSERREIFEYKKVDELYSSLSICAKNSSNLPILEGTYEECQKVR